MSARAAMMVAVLATGLAACGGHEKKEVQAPDLGPARDVRTATAVKTGGSGEVAVPASVQARQRASLSARIAASVTELPYQVGQPVAAGAVVVRLDDAALRSALAAAEAGLKAVGADLSRTEALLKKGAATPRELDEMTARMAGAQAQVTAAKDALAYAVLRAPFAGRVAARPVNLGDVVNPGMTLVEIEGQGGLEVRATVEQAVAAALRPGAKVRAVVDGQAEPITATVTAVAPAGDATTNRFEVKAGLPGRRRPARRPLRPAARARPAGRAPDHRSVRGRLRAGRARRRLRRRRGPGPPAVGGHGRPRGRPGGGPRRPRGGRARRPRPRGPRGRRPGEGRGQADARRDSPAGSLTPSSTASSRR